MTTPEQPMRARPSLEEIRASCRKLARKCALLSGAAALAPLPGAALAVELAVLRWLTSEISLRFGLPARRADAAGAASGMYAFGMARRAGSRIAMTALRKSGLRGAGAGQALRFLPLAGQAASAAFGYASVLHLGKAHIDACFAAATRIEARQPQGTLRRK